MQVTFTNHSYVPSEDGPPISPGAYFEVDSLTKTGVVVRFIDEPGTARISFEDWFEAEIETVAHTFSEHVLTYPSGLAKGEFDYEAHARSLDEALARAIDEGRVIIQ